MNSKKLLTKAEASIYINPYKDTINKLIQEAVNSYRNKPPLERLVESARTRGSSISDRILWNIQNSKELLSDNNLNIKRRYGTLRILINGQVQVVFKAVNRNLLPSSPCSNRSLNYRNQESDVQKEFPEIAIMSPVTNVYWGYIWNPVEDIRTPIVCLDGSQLMWNMEFVEEKKAVESKEANIDTRKNTTQKIRAKENVIKEKVENNGDEQF